MQGNIRRASVCGLVLCGLSLLVWPMLQQDIAAQAPELSSKPFLHIETGMHGSLMRQIAVDVSEHLLITASEDKTVRLWNLANGNLLKVLRPPQGEGNEGKLYAVAISPDGGTVATGGWTGSPNERESIYLFDTASGSLRQRLADLPGSVSHLCYSPDGRYLAASLHIEGMRVYRTSDYAEAGRDKDYKEASNGIDFDRAGRLVTSSDDGYLRLYDPAFRMIMKRKAPGGKEPHSVRFSPDGTQIAVGFLDSAVVNVLSGKDLTLLCTPDTRIVSKGDQVASVAWSPDGRLLYAGGAYRIDATRQVLCWTNSGRGEVRAIPVAMNTVLDLKPLSGGRLAVGAADPMLGVFDAAGGVVWRRMPEITDQRSNKRTLQVSRDAAIVRFGLGKYDQDLVWSARWARFSIAQRQLTLDASVEAGLQSPRTSGLAVSNWDDVTRPTLDGRVLPLDRFETSRSLAISDKADCFLLGTEWTLRLFDRKGTERWNVPAPAIAWAVNLPGDGRYAVAAFADGTIRWYTMAEGKEVLALFVHPDGRRWVTWAPEGFFDSSPGGETLIGYHLNQGKDRAGEFIGVEQMFDYFYRPDLVAQRLQPGGDEAVRIARERIGDITKVLNAGLPPDLELLSPGESQSQGEYVLQVRMKNRGGGVGRIVYKIDGVEIEGRPVDIPVPGTGTLNRKFDLGPGRHEVSAVVYNGQNKLASRSVSALVNVKRIEERPRMFVVAAGVSKYRDNDLTQGVKFAAADAVAVVGRLKELGKGLFLDVVTYTLPDDKATRKGIEDAVADVASKIQTNDVFVLYLAGHGTALDGEYHYIPWEVRYTNQEALHDQSLNQEAIRQLLNRIPVRKTLLLLDTCSSGAFATGPARALESKASIDRLARLSGRATLAATASSQMALEGYQGHGVFTFALLEALTKADRNGDGIIDVSEIADFVEELVPTITKGRWGYEQFPMRELRGQNFPLVRKP